MLTSIKKLATTLILLVVASGIILGIDYWQRQHKAASVTKLPVVAFIQNNSMPVVDQGIDGLLEGLEAAGFIRDVNYVFEPKNALGDSGTLQQITSALARGDSDIVVTFTTPAVQTFANANRQTHKPHVFALVTDPWSVGIGLQRDPPLQPTWMTGVGTMQPVKLMFQMARRLNPNFRQVGLVWNTSELNSQINTEVGRIVAKEMGFELLEANASGTSEVSTAVEAVISRGADFIWISGDTTTIAGAEVIVHAARKAGIPVISNIPGLESKGVLASVGANYNMVGRRTGEMVADVLRGRSPGTIPVEAYVPEIYTFNTTAMDKLKAKWSIPQELIEQAQVLVTPEGIIDRRPKPKARPAATTQPGGADAGQNSSIGNRRSQPMHKPVNLHVVAFSDAPPLEEAYKGLMEVMTRAGMIEGRDYKLTYSNAFMDVGTVSMALTRAQNDKAEMVFVLGTVALQNAAKRFKDRPLLFVCISDPFAAGVGKSPTDKMPNVTGVTSLAAYDKAADLIAKHYPQVRRVGTIYNPNELNSVVSRDAWRKALAEKGIELIDVAALTPAELGDAARTLCSRDIHMVGQIIDNLTSGGFNTIADTAAKAKLPVLCFTSLAGSQGALISLARDYKEMGHEAGKMVMQVMAGKSPADIPIIPLPQVKLVVNLQVAKRLGIQVPQALIDQADTVIK